MTLTPTSHRLRWLAPAGVAALVAGAAFTSNATSASGAPKLPAKTAAELLAAVQDIYPDGMSGTIVSTAKLGIPELPMGEGSSGASISLRSLATGSHTVRVWYAGESRQRIAVLGELSESDVIHNGTDLWTYTSATRRVTHTTITQPGNIRDRAKSLIGTTPLALAEKTLAAVDPTTKVTVDSTARVAGRAAYQLLVEPKDARSLVGSVRLALDAETSVPLRVQIYARGAETPALEVGFTDVSFKVPDASVFAFVPPAGSEVVEEDLSATMLESQLGGIQMNGGPGRVSERVGPDGKTSLAMTEGDGSDNDFGHDPHSVLGKGWTAVAVIPGSVADVGPQLELLDKMSTPVSGGRLIATPLLSVFISDAGPVYAGSVTPEALQTVASTGQGL